MTVEKFFSTMMQILSYSIIGKLTVGYFQPIDSITITNMKEAFILISLIMAFFGLVFVQFHVLDGAMLKFTKKDWVLTSWLCLTFVVFIIGKTL